MTVEKDDIDIGVDETRNTLVGIRFDKESKELLCWALVKVAQPQDHVVAVHVCRSTEEASKKQLLIDDYLEVYKGLCDVKKVKLTGEILTGKSIRKTLVREAKNCAATSVILGISNQCPIRGWASMARYCAKHLPPSTLILTIHRGKIVSQRGSNHSPAGHQKDPKPTVHESETPMQNQSSEARSTVVGEEPVENNYAIVEIRKEVPERSVSLHSDVSRDQMLGWPLLLRATLPFQRALDARKMPVVQWAMSLPNRPSPETVGCQSAWNEGSFLFESQSPDFTWFTYEVLSHATSQFSAENLIGKGGYSQVYKGVFRDDRKVAVKVLKPSEQAWKDFSLEVNIMSSLRHKNITSLLGVCIDNNELITVYEFMPNGSLEENLHGKNRTKSALPWEDRFRIAVGIAEALNYLHNGCSRPVVHRDVKSSNILLCDDFEPQLSDFGLAIWGPNSLCFEIYTDVVGTFGYLAPEYLMYGKVTNKLDVYSFGVVLLELLSGRKPIDSSKGQESLVIWGKQKLESGKLKGLIDPMLEEGGFEDCQMQRMVLAATLCLTRAPGLRPNMNQIVKLLKGDQEMVEALAKSSSRHEIDHRQDLNDINNDDEVYQLNLVAIKSKQGPKQVELYVEEDEMMSCSSVGANNNPCLEDYLKARSCSQSSISTTSG